MGLFNRLLIFSFTPPDFFNFGVKLDRIFDFLSSLAAKFFYFTVTSINQSMNRPFTCLTPAVNLHMQAECWLVG